MALSNPRGGALGLWLFAGMLVAGVVVLTADVIRRDREHAMAEAVATNENSARLLSQTISQALRGVATVLEAAALQGAHDDAAEANRRLREIAALQPAASAVKIFDLNTGRALASTGDDRGDAGSSLLNMIDADALAAARRDDGGADRMRVGRPVHDTDKTYISLSKSYMRPVRDGARQAILAVAYVDAAYFNDLFDKLDVGPHGAALFVNTDGIVLARRPFDASQVGRNVSASRLFVELRANPAFGSYETATLIDGVRRAVSYRAIPDLPLIVTASRATEDVYASVDSARNRDVGVGAAACLAVLAFAAFEARAARARRAAAASSARNALFLQSIFDQSPDCIKVLDGDGRLQSISRSGLCALEIDDVESVRGVDFLALFPDGSQPQLRRAVASAKGGDIGRFNAFCPTFKGAPKWWDIVVSAVGDANGRPERLIFIARDVTEQVAAREALTAAKVAAEAATDAKSRFLSAMSHELRTPLTGILGAADLLEDSLTTPRERDLLAIQKEAGRQLLGVVNNVLDWAKIEEGRIELDVGPVDLVDMVRTCLAIVRPAADRKALRLDYALETSDIALMCDRLQVQQILLNFLSNAVKFTASGQVVLTVGRTEQSRIRFAVHDTGRGVPESQRHLLFQEFSQVGAAVVEGGAGLGLAISKRLAAAMGGEIGLESALGVGSVFWFEAAFAKPAPSAARPPAASLTLAPPPERASGDGRPGPRILLAEDIAANRNLVRAMLEAEGFEVDVVGDGAAAVAAVEARDYALVLMDMQMPVLSGRQATARIRDLPERGDVAILALTANVYPEQIQLCLDAGMDGHLPKPIERSALVRTVRSWTDGRRHVRPGPDALREVA